MNDTSQRVAHRPDSGFVLLVGLWSLLTLVMVGAASAAFFDWGRSESIIAMAAPSTALAPKSNHAVPLSPGFDRSVDPFPANADSSGIIESGARSVPEPELLPAEIESLPIRGATPTEFSIKPQSEIGPANTLVAHAVSPTVDAYAEPNRSSDPIQVFDNPTERGGPLVFQALSRSGDGWIEVLLPVRPNGTRGWIKEDAVTLSLNPFQIAINVSDHELSIYRDDELQLKTEIGVGTGQTPTPIGSFYLTELLRPSDPTGIYGPFAYGLSGYSDTLRSFNGGQGVIGIHGTDNPGALGSDVSHGCIRVENDTIEEMVAFLPLGTPVNIYRTSSSIPLPTDELELSGAMAGGNESLAVK